jgi:4-aminobutyrate aminotransferase/(S)-3-amino-2-methylpropionate transaminase
MIPGAKSHALAKRLRRVESRNITYLSKAFPVFWESARGCTVRDVDGNEFLDLTSAFGVASLGHTPKAIQKAVAAQSRKMWHGMGDVHPSAVKIELLERLAKLAPGDLGVSILSSSGAEAVESAVKTARLATRKPGVICFSGGYHGLSYGTLALTSRYDFFEHFVDQLADYSITLSFPDPLSAITEAEVLNEVESLLKGKRDSQAPYIPPIGAVIVEPIQGRGGVNIPEPSFLRELKFLTKHYKALLIADEVFTGFGRTGRLFGMEHSGVLPDVMCVGKAIANGFPISACIGSPEIMKAWPVSNGEAIHTSTFLGNPLGCAMAVATLKEIERQKLVERSANLGSQWMDLLNQTIGNNPRVGEIRGSGLMIGIELVKDRLSLEPDSKAAWHVVSQCLKRGLIVLSGGQDRNVITLTPPLVISMNELRRATTILQKVVATL